MNSAGPNTVYLHGAMKARFGGPFTLHVSTARDALRALMTLLPGFRQAVEAGSWRVVRGPLRGGRTLPLEQIAVNLPGEMHLVAAAQGAKSRGGATGKIIVGAALVAAAIVFAPEAAPGVLGLGGAAFGGLSATAAGLGLGITGAQVALFGAMLAISGVSQLLSPTPKSSTQQTADTKPSYLFGGVLNNDADGIAIPVGFGAMRIPGVLISTGLDVVDINT
jgi:predicted phage tail protein